MANTRDFLLEIGCEEIPSVLLDRAMVQFEELILAGLDKAGLAHGGIKAYSTPRRMACMVEAVQEKTDEVHSVFRGPAAQIAFDADGNPTRACEGFARGKGLSVDDLVVKQDKDGKEYVFGEVFVPSRDAKEILGDLAKSVIAGISWPRSQRWGANHQKFVRPVRWLVCLFGFEILPISYADVVASNTTQGHRVLAPGAHTIECPSDYERVLKSAFVMTQNERREKILSEIAAIENMRPGMRVDTPKKVLEEVINLCEWPTCLVGTFDEEFLKVPHEIICESMLSHQRYFPMYDAQGNLTREFVVVSNADPKCSETVIDGNERVVRARLDDAKFFYEEDLEIALDEFCNRLSRVVFQEKLGTVLQKVERMEKVAQEVSDELELSDEDAANAIRATHLAKADLVSQSVVEFTSQQGVMGGYFAVAQGEPEEVALAIKEHYRPRFAGDEIPAQTCGRIVALADKLDTICGIFAIDEPPTGSSDPFAVRRATIGVIALLKSMPQVSLTDLIDTALLAYEEQGLEFDTACVKEKIQKFFLGRLSAIAKEEGVRADTIEAVAESATVSPLEYLRRAHALEQARQNDAELFDDLATAYARASHLSKEELGDLVNTEILGEAELNLYQACELGAKTVDEALESGNYDQALRALAELRAPIDKFFDDVLVMDEDTEVRENRLKLLNKFVKVFKGVANIGALAKK